MKKEDAYATNLVSDGNVSRFLEHLGNYSEEQVTDFLKSVYAASQERIAKGKRLANDPYPNEEDLDKAIERFFK